MNILDFGLGIGLLLALLLGWKVRVIRLLGLCLTVLAGVWMANHFQGQVAEVFTTFSPSKARFAAWFVLFLATLLTVGLLGGIVLQAAQIDHLHWLDQLLGALLAGFLFLAASGAGLITLQNLDRSNPWRMIQESAFAPDLVRIVEPIHRSFLKSIPAIRDFFSEPEVKPAPKPGLN